MSQRAAAEPRAIDPQLHSTMVKTIKGLSMDAVEAATCGHPGLPMGAADMATVLWTRFMAHDPTQPQWPDRDRFVLSAGHGSMLIYSLLHLTGYELSLDELKNFRQWGSKTPGHPEYGHTAGVEVTTGPLGTGFATGVGMAMAERFLAHRYNREGHAIIDHFTYGIVSDGDLMEGVASEAASLAGHLGLGKLIYLYDDNQISIDGGTEITFTEDVAKRFEAYGWQVTRVDGHDPVALSAALARARADLDRPSLICARTVIGQGAPTKQGTSGVHGARLGADEVAATKKGMDWPLDPFHVPPGLTESLAGRRDALTSQRVDWDERFAAYASAHAELAAELRSLWAGELPAGTLEALPSFSAGDKLATRKASHKCVSALSKVHPTLLGGSADLAGSNGTDLPDESGHSKENPTGRIIHFGVREHAMAAVCNGLALHGGVRPFDATFLVFSDFMRGGIRLSALMGLPVVHILTHDSILLGEDGPTHQPVEHAMSLRAMPNLHVVRPADARETVAAWRHAMTRTDGPTALLLTRQGVPILEGTEEDLGCGATVVWEPDGVGVDALDGILIATGSEVHVCVDAAQALAAEGTQVRVVSMPCWELFVAADASERDAVLPPSVTRRLSVEAGTTLGWARWANENHGIDRFGASAPASRLAQEFGFTAQAIAAKFAALG
jgi:transketolase